MFAPQGIGYYGEGTGDITPGPYNYILRGTGLGSPPEWQDISVVLTADPDGVDGGDATPDTP